MKLLSNIIVKYSVILIISYLFSSTWFYLKNLFLPIETVEDINFWHDIPQYSSYTVRVIVAVLLLIDTKKYQLNYLLIPLIGLFYPLLGICVFLILLAYSELEKKEKLV